MKLFNVGALRPATDDARLSAAKDLVQRTLAQHGLVPQSVKAAGQNLSDMPSLENMLSKFTAPTVNAGRTHAALPERNLDVIHSIARQGAARIALTFLHPRQRA